MEHVIIKKLLKILRSFEPYVGILVVFVLLELIDVDPKYFQFQSCCQ